MKTQYQIIEDLVKKYPNDMQLGEAVSNYIRWQNDLIEKVAETILNSKESLNVIDPNDDKIVGSLNPSKVIKVLFGS